MEFLLTKLSVLNHVGIFRIDGNTGERFDYQEHSEYNPIVNSAMLRNLLIEGAKQQEKPYIFKDEYMVYFACVKQQQYFYMIGPMSLKLLEWVELHQYYNHYEMGKYAEKRLIQFSFADMLDIVEVAACIVQEREFTDDELIEVNGLAAETKEQEEHEQILYDMKEEEEEFYHHTYQEEKRLLDSIREGRMDDALRYSRNMDGELGKLSKRELNHWKNVATVAITLSTRAAIDGGLSPAIAYRISDFYIQKSDECSDIAHVIKYRDHALEELTKQVIKKQERKSSSYVERCKDYIDKNYKNKIYLSDMAENLGISETYLSKLFKKETGERLQDYIVDVRLEHVANFLKFSNVPISNIAEYVHFPSQSYMGNAFKKKYNMTPKQYRDKNRPAEFSE